MADKKIKNSDLFEKGLFSQSAEQAKALLSVMGDLEKQFKEILNVTTEISKTTPLKGYDNIEKVNKAINDQDDAVKSLNRLEKEKIRLAQRLQDLRKGRLDDNIALREAVKAETQQLRVQAKENLKVLGIYKQESARLTRLRKEYKDLTLEKGKNTKEAKALLKEITKLDKKLKDVDASVGQNQRSVRDYKKALEGVNSTAKKVTASLGGLAILNGIKESFAGTTEGSAALEKVLSRITVTTGVLVERLVKIFSDPNLSFANFFDKLRDGFQGFGDQVEKALELNDKAIDTEAKLFKTVQERERQNARLLEQQAKLTIQADDNTKSIKDQRIANEELLKVELQILNNEVFIAKQREQIARQRAEALPADKARAEELTRAIFESEQKQAEAVAKRAEVEKRERELLRDDIELDLDQLIDIADRRKTINESIIADDTLTFEERTKALDKATNDIEASFIKQAEKIKEGTGIIFNIDDLINEEDTVKLNERIKALGLDEIRQNRLREIIQERIQAVEDLRKVSDELDRKRLESNEISSDTVLISDTLNELDKEKIDLEAVLLALEEKRLQNEIDNLKFKIGLAKEGSAEQIALNQQLQEKLLEQETNRIQKEQELKAKEDEQEKARNQKRIDEARELREVLLQGARAFADKTQENLEANIDREISALERRREALLAIASRGGEDAERNLAQEEKRRAELERRREQARRRQQRIELGLSVFETYSNKVANNDPNPLGSTIRDISVLQSFINSLPTFWEGAERVGDTLTPNMRGRDGHIVRVDGSERVVPGNLNSKLGRMTNAELVDRALSNDNQIGVVADLEAVKAGLSEVVKAINQKPVPSWDYNKMKNALIDSVEQKGKKENAIRRNIA